MKPLVTIGVLAYNRPEGLRNTLEALCRQSYTRLEIHVSDDCSTNLQVNEVIQEYCQKDTRIRGYKQTQNLGIIKNHQFLLSKISVDTLYMMWACDDDNWHPDYIKVCVQSLEENPEAILSSTGNKWVKNGKPCDIHYNEQTHTLGIIDPITRYKKVLSNTLWWNHAFYGVIRRSAYQKVPLSNSFAFDILFITQLSLYGQFIQLSQRYFEKAIGGYGSQLKQNLRSIKSSSKIDRHLPRLSFFLSLRKAIRGAPSFNTGQRRELLVSSLKTISSNSIYGQSWLKGLSRLILKSIGAIKFVFTWFRIGQYQLAWLIHIHRLPVSDFTFSKKAQSLYSQKLGLIFKASGSLFGSYYEFLKLKEEHKASFAHDHSSGKNLITIRDITLELREGYYSFLLNEIFANEVYHFNTTLPTIVIDIGTNVGIAALYFARKTNVKKVFGFEPFKQTFEAAHDNFKHNPQLQSKIHLENFGLSDQEQTVLVDYDFATSQLTSIKKTNHSLPEQVESKPATVQVKRATETLEPILKKYPDEKKVLKIDTEGSEYEIIQGLNKSGLLRSFDYIMIEWHGDGHDVLVDTLKDNNFEVSITDRDFSSAIGETGMIYAHSITIRESPFTTPSNS